MAGKRSRGVDRDQALRAVTEGVDAAPTAGPILSSAFWSRPADFPGHHRLALWNAPVAGRGQAAPPTTRQRC
ncbi:hypothetical protein ACWCOW_36230 [Streptomyces sp. NPDC001939]